MILFIFSRNYSHHFWQPLARFFAVYDPLNSQNLTHASSDTSDEINQSHRQVEATYRLERPPIW